MPNCQNCQNCPNCQNCQNIIHMEINFSSNPFWGLGSSKEKLRLRNGHFRWQELLRKLLPWIFDQFWLQRCQKRRSFLYFSAMKYFGFILINLIVHRDAYVLGQGYWIFTRYLAHLVKNLSSIKWSQLIMLQYYKRIFDVNIKLLPLHLLLLVRKMVIYA